MRVLFDHGTPAPLALALDGHDVRFAKSLGWDTFSNGALLAASEAVGFHVVVTTDKNIRYQQNLAGHAVAIVVLMNAQWPVLRHHVHRVRAAVDAAEPGSYVEVAIE